MSKEVWLRAETKPNERRSPLAPRDAKKLIDAGIEITVEQSNTRIFTDEEFAVVGCRMVEPGSWHDAPRDSLILGLKELPMASTPIQHCHCYFAHAFRGQPHADSVLRRFREGDGRLFDLEYLLDAEGRRIAAFGFWAGYVGAALGIAAYAHRSRQIALGPQTPFESPSALIESVQEALRSSDSALPRVLVTGARGRAGRGAVALVEAMGGTVTPWDLAETAQGGPFQEIVDFDVLVHCAAVQKPSAPFFTLQQLNGDCRLSVVVDVTCDVGGPLQVLPLDVPVTSFQQPTQRVENVGAALHAIVIDHLPSLLPKESSEDFSQQLTPVLLSYFSQSAPWMFAGAMFERSARSLS